MRTTKLIENISAKFIAWLMSIVMAFLTVVRVLYRSYIDVTYQEIIHYRNDNVLLAVLFLVLTIEVVWILQKKHLLEEIPEKPLVIGMLIYVAVVSGFWA